VGRVTVTVGRPGIVVDRESWSTAPLATLLGEPQRGTKFVAGCATWGRARRGTEGRHAVGPGAGSPRRNIPGTAVARRSTWRSPPWRRSSCSRRTAVSGCS